MVNLLFITNCTKIDAIKNLLQPLLTVRIDTVADFDYGLKDVFEKRPATVFIQDQITGVTGESVARHIQMLLGNSAPTFIYMHEGSPKAKPIKGLFEYLIDLSQDNAKIVVDIQATLKSQLGAQWDKIFIPPKLGKAVVTHAVTDSKVIPAVTDKRVVDFISELDDLGDSSVQNINPEYELSLQDDPFEVVSSPHDQLAEMLAETASEEPEKNETTTAAVQQTIPKKTSVSGSAELNITSQQHKQPVSVKQMEMTVSLQEDLQSALKVITPVVSDPHTKAEDRPVSISMPESAIESPPPQQSSPADFVIVRESPIDDVAPEDLLRVFEGNYYSSSGGWKRNLTIATFLALSFGGVFWYIFKQKPHLLAFIPSPSAPSVAVPSVVAPPRPVIAVQKTVSTPIQKPKESVLPTFIPKSGVDAAYALNNPGWERYVDATLEYRLFRVADRIKAIQVLGVNKQVISEQKLKTVLSELLGENQYKEKSSEQKHGYRVTQAVVGNKADLLIYRKKAALRAFVVSLN